MSATLDTIVAPATPIGRSALAIVRIDGPESLSILERLSGRTGWEPRFATRVQLQYEGGAIDDSVALFFASPASYTGNDLVELTVHGSPVAVSALVEAAMALGARRAEPGEFTERAVLNGKIDLVQAEAVVDLIDSRTTLQARLSLANLAGGVSDDARAVRATVLDVISRLEAALDFADEGYDFIDRPEAISRLRAEEARLARMLDLGRRGVASRSGLTAVLLGKPNAGKSTLLNALVGSERAIVTSQPGTTRDLLRETIEVGGLPVTVVDTAGLRETGEEIESIGIRRSREAAADADLILYLVDSSVGIDDEDRQELDRAREAKVVFTKSDLLAEPRTGEELSISAATREGIPELLAVLDRWVRESWAIPEGQSSLVNRRQTETVERARQALGQAVASLEAGATEEMTLVDLYVASRAIGELTGEITHGEIMESIFSRFCIGK